MKRVVIVAPQFPPCNLTASHRCRYFAEHLHKFGWQPIILTLKPKYYEGDIENDLLKLLPDELNIIRTSAFSNKPIKIFGDLGLRSLYWHYHELCSLVKINKIDLIYIPIPPNFTSILGYLINKRFGIPYAIDYIDPWVHEWPEAKKIFSKAWLSYQLSKIIEPIVLKNVSLITSVAPLYYEKIQKKYSLNDSVKFLSIPYGIDMEEFNYLDDNPKKTFLYNKSSEYFNFIYAGAMLPKAYKTLNALFNALKIIQMNRPEIAKKIKMYFVGTGINPNDSNGYNIMHLINKYDLAGTVFEYPARITYFDVLSHLKKSHCIIILGSTERHYTPSKVFQSILSKRPLLAILHEESTAVDIIKNFNADYLISFSDNTDFDEIANKISDAILSSINNSYDVNNINWNFVENYTTESMVKKLANAFNNTNLKDV